MPPMFPRDIQRAVLTDSRNPAYWFYVRGFHALWQNIPVHFHWPQRWCSEPIHHISRTLWHGIQFALCPFRSTLLGASQLVSFPAGTKMLQFPAFPIFSDWFRYPWFEACMRLARAYRSLPRPSSALEPSYPLNGAQNFIICLINLPMQRTVMQKKINKTKKYWLCFLHGQNFALPFKKNFKRFLTNSWKNFVSVK